MDGNARWARRARAARDRRPPGGTKAAHRTIEACLDLGIESLCIFAFSTENWSRSREEVEAIMELFGETIERELPNLMRKRVRVRFVGRRDRAPRGPCRADGARRGATAERPDAALDRVRLRRPGRDRRRRPPARRGGRRPRDIDENAIASRLYAPDMPEPDFSSGRRASSASRTSCSGRSHTRSSSSSTRSGPTSESATCARARGVRQPPPALRRPMSNWRSRLVVVAIGLAGRARSGLARRLVDVRASRSRRPGRARRGLPRGAGVPAARARRDGRVGRRPARRPARRDRAGWPAVRS